MPDPGRCPACAAVTGSCQCVAMPEEFRRLGFSGLFHTTARADQATRRAWEAKGVPCLIAGDRWVLVRFVGDRAVLVRRDDQAMVDVVTRSPDNPDPIAG